MVFSDHHDGRDKTGAICFYYPVRLCLILKLFQPLTRVQHYRGVEETRGKQFLNWKERGNEEKKREIPTNIQN